MLFLPYKLLTPSKNDLIKLYIFLFIFILLNVLPTEHYTNSDRNLTS